MARKPRIEFPGGLYHIITRGNRREEVFLDDSDYKRYLDLLSHYHNRYNFLLYAYVLMPNHTHLLIEQNETPISKIMQGINQSYTQYFNKRYNKVGHLFQGRYKALLCDKDGYLLVLVRYIHLNPVRAHIVKMPEDYVWSSHNAYIGDKKQDFVDKNFVLIMFSRNRRTSIMRYIQFMKEGIGESDGVFHIGEFVGDKTFEEEMKSKGSYGIVYEIALSLDELTTIIAEKMKVPIEALFSRTRNREYARVRGITGYVARKIIGLNVTEIADYFNRDIAVISKGIRKIEKEIMIDVGLRKTVQEIEKSAKETNEEKYANS